MSELAIGQIARRKSGGWKIYQADGWHAFEPPPGWTPPGEEGADPDLELRRSARRSENPEQYGAVPNEARTRVRGIGAPSPERVPEAKTAEKFVLQGATLGTSDGVQRLAQGFTEASERGIRSPEKIDEELRVARESNPELATLSQLGATVATAPGWSYLSRGVAGLGGRLLPGMLPALRSAVPAGVAEGFAKLAPWAQDIAKAAAVSLPAGAALRATHAPEGQAAEEAFSPAGAGLDLVLASIFGPLAGAMGRSAMKKLGDKEPALREAIDQGASLEVGKVIPSAEQAEIIRQGQELRRVSPTGTPGADLAYQRAGDATMDALQTEQAAAMSQVEGANQTAIAGMVDPLVEAAKSRAVRGQSASDVLLDDLTDSVMKQSRERINAAPTIDDIALAEHRQLAWKQENIEEQVGALSKEIEALYPNRTATYAESKPLLEKAKEIILRSEAADVTEGAMAAAAKESEGYPFLAAVDDEGGDALESFLGQEPPAWLLSSESDLYGGSAPTMRSIARSLVRKVDAPDPPVGSMAEIAASGGEAPAEKVFRMANFSVMDLVNLRRNFDSAARWAAQQGRTAEQKQFGELANVVREMLPPDVQALTKQQATLLTELEDMRAGIGLPMGAKIDIRQSNQTSTIRGRLAADPAKLEQSLASAITPDQAAAYRAAEAELATFGLPAGTRKVPEGRSPAWDTVRGRLSGDPGSLRTSPLAAERGVPQGLDAAHAASQYESQMKSIGEAMQRGDSPDSIARTLLESGVPIEEQERILSALRERMSAVTGKPNPGFLPDDREQMATRLRAAPPDLPGMLPEAAQGPYRQALGVRGVETFPFDSFGKDVGAAATSPMHSLLNAIYRAWLRDSKTFMPTRRATGPGRVPAQSVISRETEDRLFPEDRR